MSVADDVLIRVQTCGVCDRGFGSESELRQHTNDYEHDGEPWSSAPAAAGMSRKEIFDVLLDVLSGLSTAENGGDVLDVQIQGLRKLGLPVDFFDQRDEP